MFKKNELFLIFYQRGFLALLELDILLELNLFELEKRPHIIYQSLISIVSRDRHVNGIVYQVFHPEAAILKRWLEQ